MSDREKIIDKIRKLKAMADSAQQTSTEAEAQAFAARVQELLTRHKIEEAELRSFADADDPTDPIVELWVPHGGFTKYAGRKSTAEGFPFKRKRVQWSEMLGSMIARANYCRILVTEGRNSICFVGKEIDAQASVDMFLYLTAVAERVAWIEYQTYFDACAAKGRPELARGFRASFLFGFTSRLGQRYDQHLQDMRDAWLKDAKALVVLTNAVELVKKHIEDKFKTTAKSVEPKIANHAGWLRGREVANGIKLADEAKKLNSSGEGAA